MQRRIDSSGQDVERMRERLSSVRGPAYWRSLEELSRSPEFEGWLQREFPEQASEWQDPIGRRRFLHLMGASLALAGAGACTTSPPEVIVPYTRAPEQIVPGRPLYYATAFLMGGLAEGILVESHMGRPTKIEGNPQHPASLGGTSRFAQASILDLYDPDRAQMKSYLARVSTWSHFLRAMELAVEAERPRAGAGLRILTETVTSPTLGDLLRRLLEAFPQAKWHQWEPVNRDAVKAGARMAFGEVVDTHFRFDAAGVVLSLDADFLAGGPGHVRYARDFASRRVVTEGAFAQPSRLYVVETTPSPTGASADHRLALRPSRIEAFAVAVAQRLGVPVAAPDVAPLDTPHARWVEVVAADLARHRGESVVIVGDQQPPVVHALAHAINHALENVDRTVVYTDPVEARPVDQMASLRELVDDLKAGEVETLIVLGGNPAYSAPGDLAFAEQMLRAERRVHLSSHSNETSRLCHWHIPEAHPLESWGDARAFDGTVTILQPLIAPLYGGKTALEVVSALLGKPGPTPHEIVREYWQPRGLRGAFEVAWAETLHDGSIAGSRFAGRSVTLRDPAGMAGSTSPVSPSPAEADSSTLEICFQPDPNVWDGRFANNGWLQELPKPITKLTWDNAVLVSPETAERLGISNEQVVRLTYGGRTLSGPVWIVPGQATETITLHLGYGRRQAGRVGDGAGFDVHAFRTSAAPWFDVGVGVAKTSRRFRLACTQHHHLMEGRDLVRVRTVGESTEHAESHHAESAHTTSLTLYPHRPEVEASDNAWGMTIELGACTGCNACVVACQAENNIPIVGKSQVAAGREMHWIRVDRYYTGPAEAPQFVHQPVPCMQCENAPCEVVCPVGATVHSDEGLNDMVYNRCVGTRYCSNNCPYKVRRFNYLQFADFETPVLKLLHNPDVTVRSRGVMEKCTYCVQRINQARIEAKKESRPIRDGDVVTACQGACPSQAIVFGNLKDSQSRASHARSAGHNYSLLPELNTQPRTTYGARFRNPNPDMSEEIA